MMKKYIVNLVLFICGIISMNAQQVIDYTPKLIDIGTIINRETINKSLYSSLTLDYGDIVVFTLVNEVNVYFRFPAFNEAYGENIISIVKRVRNTGSVGDIWYGEYICQSFPIKENKNVEFEVYQDEVYYDMYLLKVKLSPGTYMFSSRYSEYSQFEEGYSLYNLTIEFDGNFPTSKFIEQSTDKSYLTRITPSVETKNIKFIENVIKFDNSVEAQITTEYFDGLGRQMQIIQQELTPNKQDLVTVQEYDNLGRESNVWLSSVMDSYKGKYFNPYLVKQHNKETSGDQKPYSSPVYENSPLSRVLEQYGPGADWHTNNKAVRTAYLTNVAGNDTLGCKLYKVTENLSLTNPKNYETGELYVTRIEDEDGNASFEFKDKLGQVVLTRQLIRKSNSKILHDTYYVYDDFGNQCFVLPPRIQEEGITQAKLNELVYQYKYDHRNRCIWKKLPGVDPVYYAYDKADQLIFIQDGEQRTKGEWAFSIPDAFGRVVLAGICTDTLNISNKVVKGLYAGNGIYKRYTIQIDGINKQFVKTPVILSANYYDNYDFRGMTEIPSSNTVYTPQSDYGTWYAGDYTEANKYKNKGMLTGSLVAQMDANGTAGYLYSVMYYDDRGRLIQTKSNNHLGGVEEEYMAYNFTGQPVKKLHIHTGKNNAPATKKQEEYAYNYDHAGRLLKTTHKLNNGTESILAENEYDELGRLKNVKRANNNQLKTEYAYNIRSWTKSISSPLFNQTLYYNDSYASVKRYNGNIGAMKWQIKNEPIRGYAFSYDNLSRLTYADYLEDHKTSSKYRASYTYDKHGNMLTTSRYGKTTAGETYGLVDNLKMTYGGNQLIKVADTGQDVSFSQSADFKDHAEGNGVYTYNKNGAMNKDTHKGITGIRYNSLNLPVSIEIDNGSVKGRTKYVYSASGVKLQVTHETDMNPQTATVMGSAPFSMETTNTKVTDYVGNKIYEDGILKKILVDGGYIDMETGEYHFYITDHLGNNRVVAKADGTVVQKNHYYPFGMEFAENSGDSDQPYKYNGKELDKMHGLNMYDYSARYYEPAIGRFTTVDPHAENYYAWSPYSYCFSNPIRFIDKDGRDPGNPEHWKRFGIDLIKATKIAVSVGLQFAGSAKLAGMGTAANLNALSIDLVGLKDGVLFHPGADFDKTEIKKEAEVTVGIVTVGTSSVVKNEENNQTVLEETIKGGLGPFELQRVETTPVNSNFEKVGSPKEETEVRVSDAEFKLKAIVGFEIGFDFNKGWEALKKLVYDK